MASSPGFPAGQIYGDSEPPFLPIGTDVSAKYKGAFCEAKIKKISQNVKCRVSFKGGGAGQVVSIDNIRGNNLRVNGLVEARYPEGAAYRECTITKVLDQSLYTVVFDDGDETTLKRTSLCLKSGKHYAESESLDHLPLTNPEHFGNPVSVGKRGMRPRRSATRGFNTSNYAFQVSDNEDNDFADCDATGSIDDEEDDSASNITQKSGQVSKVDEQDVPGPSERPANASWGRVVMFRVDHLPDKRGPKPKSELWFPALIVNPSAHDKPLDDKIEYLVRSFKDGRFYVVAKKETKDFSKQLHANSIENTSTTLRSALEKVLAYIEKNELPQNWDRDVLLTITDDHLSTADADAACDAALASSELDSAADDDFEEEVNEPNNEEKDRFVAQLYKFMDEHNTPINKTPTVNGRDVDLYSLYRQVQKLGGFNRITNKNNWKLVYSKMNMPSCSSEASENSAINQLKAAYKKYLFSFNEFYRKLGNFSAFVQNSNASRSSSRPARNERSWRSGDTKEVTPAKTRRKKSATDEPAVKDEESFDNADDKSPDDSAADEKRGPGKPPGKKRGPKAGRKSIAKPVKVEPVDSDDGGPEDGGPDMDHGEESDSDAVLPGPFIGKDVEVNANDKIRVKYGKGKQIKVYDAKVLKTDKNIDMMKRRYFVHYNGWNTRYDEWIKRNRIVEVVRDKFPKRRGAKPKSPRADDVGGDGREIKSEPKEAPPTPSKRGRPPSAASRHNTEGAKPGPTTPGKSVSKERPIGPGKRSRHRSENGGSQESQASSSSQVNTSGAFDFADESCEDSTSRFSKEDSVSSASNLASDSKRTKVDLVDVLEKESTRPDLSDDEDSSPKTVKNEERVEDKSAPAATRSESLARSSSYDQDAKATEPSPSTDIEDDGPPTLSPQRSIDEKSVDEEDARSGKRKRHGNSKEFSKEKEKYSERRDKVDDRRKKKLFDCDDSPKKKRDKSKKSKEDYDFTEKRDDLDKERRRKSKHGVESPSLPNTQEEKIKVETPIAESSDTKSKRKRAAIVSVPTPTKSPSASHPAPVAQEKKEEPLLPKKRSKRDDDKPSKKDEEVVIQESLREDDKPAHKEKETIVPVQAPTEKIVPTASVVASESAPSSEGAGAFLLCAEEVPMSPEHVSPEVVEEEPSIPSSATSTFASAVAPAAPNPGAGQTTSGTSTGHSVPSSQAHEVGHFTPPTTPDSLRSGTLSSLTPPHERESQHDIETQNANHKSTANSSSNSDGEGNDKRASESTSTRAQKTTYGSPPHMSEDSCSHTGPNESSQTSNVKKEGNSSSQSPAQSPRKRKRGRTRTSSTSEQTKDSSREKGYKTRGSSGRRARKLDLDSDRYSPSGTSALDLLASQHSSSSPSISLSNFTPNAFLANIVPVSKYNFCVPIDENFEAEKRIQILQDRLQELRKTYINIKSEVATLERRRKKYKRKDRSAAHSPNGSSLSATPGKPSLDRSVSSETSDAPGESRRPDVTTAS